MISSKHSHTFAHFCLSARYKNCLEIVSKTASVLQALLNVTKSDFFRFQAVLASKLAPTWVPKTDPKSTQNLRNRLQISTSLQEAPKIAPNLEKRPQICKNLQKWYQHGRIMGLKFYQNPCQKRLQGEISWKLENIKKRCNNRLQQYHLGCIMTTMHALAFFHIA